MALPKFVQVPPQPLERFKELLGAERYAGIEQAAERARGALLGRAIWHVSSTMRGGGVAEILHSLLPYVRGAGIDTRWVVLREAEEFFTACTAIRATGESLATSSARSTSGCWPRAPVTSPGCSGRGTSSTSTTPRPRALSRR